MEWIKIDIYNLPQGEVLAANFAIYTFGYKEKNIGYLSIVDGIIECENEHEILGNCTHYIDIDNFDI